MVIDQIMFTKLIRSHNGLGGSSYQGGKMCAFLWSRRRSCPSQITTFNQITKDCGRLMLGYRIWTYFMVLSGFRVPVNPDQLLQYEQIDWRSETSGSETFLNRTHHEISEYLFSDAQAFFYFIFPMYTYGLMIFSTDVTHFVRYTLHRHRKCNVYITKPVAKCPPAAVLW